MYIGCLCTLYIVIVAGVYIWFEKYLNLHYRKLDQEEAKNSDGLFAEENVSEHGPSSVDVDGVSHKST